MNTILIVEHDVNEIETLIDLCSQSSKELQIHTVRDEESANSILSDTPTDLIICNSTFPEVKDGLVLAEIIQAFPYIPVIAIAPVNTVSREDIMALGVSALFEKPFNDKILIETIEELVELSSTGTMRGIPTHSFLQMLESEEKSCTLHIFNKKNTGLIFIKDGLPIDAETDSLSGEQAIYEIISWEEVIIEIKFFNGQRESTITKPLISLIMEGFRLKDEREAKKKEEQNLDKPQHRLQQVSLAGQRLALDIGLRLKLEFDTIEPSLDSSLVGMIPENCIIAATPAHFTITGTQLETGSHIRVKYLYMGKLCLFKSRLLKSIDSPQHMLFLEYPTVIHYHEMRKNKRTPTYIPCAITLSDNQQYFGAFIDLSSSGGLCQLKSKGNKEIPEIQIKQEIEMSCLLPGHMEEQHIKGVIRNFRKNSQETHIGIQFSELPDNLKKTIERYLYSIERLNSPNHEEAA
jgi:c-di-GMP-binding flagellar brake protein YcgR/CheY-like chemotaxis protein